MPDPTPEPNAILDFLRRNSAPAVDMWRNAETGLANATQQFNERASGDLQRYFGVNAGPDTISLLTALMGGVKAPGQPVRIPNPIKAYHGSPHDFNEFDLSKIGTGEGAQAYGHGLYFAENPKVAEGYRAPDPMSVVDMGKATQSLDPTERAQAYLELRKGNAQEALFDMDRDAASLYGPVAAAHGAARKLIETGQAKRPGRMYEVALHATPESFLNLDETPGGQSQHVKDAIKRSGLDPNTEIGPEEAGAFGKAGMPGLRYLDQGSRAEGKGTSNYVVWSPEIIEILRKYGLIAAPTAGAIANAISQPQQSQQQ